MLGELSMPINDLIYCNFLGVIKYENIVNRWDRNVWKKYS
jgi:hypothetical protein